jgi:hypothetical protein
MKLQECKKIKDNLKETNLYAGSFNIQKKIIMTGTPGNIRKNN